MRRINLLAPVNGLPGGLNPQSVPDGLAAELINRGLAVAADPVYADRRDISVQPITAVHLAAMRDGRLPVDVDVIYEMTEAPYTWYRANAVGELAAVGGGAVTLVLPDMTTAVAAGTPGQKVAHRDALGLGPVATMMLAEAQVAVSGDKIPLTQKGAANGVATLGADSKIPAAQMPDISIVDYLGQAASQAAMLALTAQKGDWCSRADTGTVFVCIGTPTALAGWQQLAYPASAVQSVAGLTGAVTLAQLVTALSGQYASAAQGANLYAGGNLIANGNCYTGDTTNFSGWGYDVTYTPAGASGAYKLPVSGTYSNLPIGDAKMSVVANKLLEFSASMLLGSISGGNHNSSCIQYFYVNCFDTDGNEIGDAMAQTYAGSAKTTLALPLNPGDTTVTLTSSTGWAGAAAQWHQRAFKWWPFISAAGIYGYQESSGKINLPYTYSRNTSPKMVAGGTYTSVSGNVLTLSTATFPAGWTGPSIPAGTPIQNTEGGGARLYFSSLTYAAAGEYVVSGTMSANGALSPTVVLFAGTAKIRIEGLLNFNGTGVSELRLGNLMLRYK